MSRSGRGRGSWREESCGQGDSLYRKAPPVQGGSPCTGRVCLHREILTALRESLYTETIPVHEESPCTVCRETHPVQGEYACTGRFSMHRESPCTERHMWGQSDKNTYVFLWGKGGHTHIYIYI